jgi:hypothetical protein
MRNVWLWAAGAALVATTLTADAHRDGCHRWHSCPSDSGTYECGDLGYCSQCPDNGFCKDRKPRGETPKN